MSAILLWISGVAAVVFAVFMLTARSLYAASVCLLVVLLQAAVFFYASGAPLLAFLQAIVYAGAVMVLIVVAIMASSGPSERRWGAMSVPRPLAAAALALLAGELVVLSLAAGPAGGAGAAETQRLIGPVLFGPFALATEAATILLFLAGLALLPSGTAAE